MVENTCISEDRRRERREGRGERKGEGGGYERGGEGEEEREKNTDYFVGGSLVLQLHNKIAL